jgi:hypothetical protein
MRHLKKSIFSQNIKVVWHPPAVFVAGFVGVLNNHLSKLHNFLKVSTKSNFPNGIKSGLPSPVPYALETRTNIS